MNAVSLPTTTGLGKDAIASHSGLDGCTPVTTVPLVCAPVPGPVEGDIVKVMARVQSIGTRACSAQTEDFALDEQQTRYYGRRARWPLNSSLTSPVV